MFYRAVNATSALNRRILLFRSPWIILTCPSFPLSVRVIDLSLAVTYVRGGVGGVGDHPSRSTPSRMRKYGQPSETTLQTCMRFLQANDCIAHEFSLTCTNTQWYIIPTFIARRELRGHTSAFLNLSAHLYHLANHADVSYQPISYRRGIVQ